MSFKRVKPLDARCQYVVKYRCDCTKASGSKSPLSFEVAVVGHKRVSTRSVYLYGQGTTKPVKFCPECSTALPTAEAILAMEELQRSEAEDEEAPEDEEPF